MRVIALLLLVFLAGCGRETEHSLLSRACDLYEHRIDRYAHIIKAENDEDVLAQARLLAHDMGIGFWDWLLRDEDPATPLQRAALLIERDIIELAKMAYRLERRALFGGVYEQINQLRKALIVIKRTLVASPDFTQENQFLEQRRLQRAQLYAIREQTRVIAEKSSAP